MANEGLAGNDLGVMIPEIFSKKVALAFSKITDFANLFANNQWEGEIKAAGDTVHIVLPDPNSVAIVDGDACPTLSGLAPTSTSMVIDKQKTFAFAITDKEQAQSQFKNLEDAYASIVAHNIAITKSKEMMKAVLDFDNTNGEMGEAGTQAVPEALTVDNVYGYFVGLKMKLFEAGAVDARGKYPFTGESQETQELSARVVIGTKVASLLLQATQLTHPTANGDMVIEDGQVKRVAGLEVIVDTALDTVEPEIALSDGSYAVIAGTMNGITKASQISKVEKLRDPNCFQDIVRGMELYGFKILHPECIVRGVVSIA